MEDHMTISSKFSYLTALEDIEKILGFSHPSVRVIREMYHEIEQRPTRGELQDRIEYLETELEGLETELEKYASKLNI
jgi:hypothetical protein